jgi:hypothetical protein
LTGDQHTDHISNGQRVSRHSLQTLLYFLFSPPHIFFNSILASRTSGTFGFAPTHKANPSAKPKEPLLANTPMTFLPRTSFFLRILTSFNLITA